MSHSHASSTCQILELGRVCLLVGSNFSLKEPQASS